MHTVGQFNAGGRTRWVRAVAIAGVMGTALVSCSRSAQEAIPPVGTVVASGNSAAQISDDSPQRGGKVVYGLGAETNGWNPALNQFSSAGLLVARSVFDPLAAFADDLTVHPFLAEKFDHDADYRNWTITLRAGVKFHNGTPLTADAVKQGQDYLMASPVYGGAYRTVESMSTDGVLRLVVHLKEPWVSYPILLTGQLGMVAEPTWMKSNDGLHPIGTGPFVFDRWQPGSNLVVKRNPAYWQSDAHNERYPYLDEVEFKVLTDASSRSATLMSGTADIIQAGGPEQITDYRRRAAGGEYQVLSDEHSETGEVFLQLNTAAKPFDDPAARQALASATDSKAYAEITSAGLFEPATGPFGKDSAFAGPTGYPAFDQSRARELVAKVKADHDGAFSFTIKGTPETSTGLQFLQQQWAEVGIDANIEIVEQAKLIIEVVTGGYQATIWAGFDSPDPLMDSIFVLPEEVRPVPQLSLNLSRLVDPKIGDAMRDARQNSDRAKVVEDYRTMARRLGEDVPYIWLFHSQSVVVASNRVVNLTHVRLPDGANALSMHSGAHGLYQVWLRR